VVGAVSRASIMGFSHHLGGRAAPLSPSRPRRRAARPTQPRAGPSDPADQRLVHRPDQLIHGGPLHRVRLDRQPVYAEVGVPAGRVHVRSAARSWLFMPLFIIRLRWPGELANIGRDDSSDPRRDLHRMGVPVGQRAACSRQTALSGPPPRRSSVALVALTGFPAHAPLRNQVDARERVGRGIGQLDLARAARIHQEELGSTTHWSVEHNLLAIG
jgi:hypothetical protein